MTRKQEAFLASFVIFLGIVFTNVSAFMIHEYQGIGVILGVCTFLMGAWMLPQKKRDPSKIEESKNQE